MRLGLISSAYPPGLDGIGDYTFWMARGLSALKEVDVPVAVYTRFGNDPKKSADIEISQFFDPEHPQTFSRLPETLEGDYANKGRELDWLILQYNPFGWGRRGFCPWVPAALQRLRRTSNRPRIATMFHETTVPRWPWRYTLMYLWQYPIFRAVCRSSDVAFVSTERWIPQVRRAAPNLPVHHLPVGSNLPLCDISYDEARSRIGIGKDVFVLGVFGGAHISRRLDWIAAAFNEASRRRPAVRTALLYVGTDGDTIRRACPNVDLIDCGALPAEEVGVRLRVMNAVLSPFLDGMSTRRTSVISVLHHGIPVASTRTAWTDQLFLTGTPPGLFLSTATSPEAYAMETADWLERLPAGGVPDFEVAGFHDRHFNWQEIAHTTVRHLW